MSTLPPSPWLRDSLRSLGISRLRPIQQKLQTAILPPHSTPTPAESQIAVAVVTPFTCCYPFRPAYPAA